MTTKHDYEPILIDDGTLDTVVSVDGREYRYTWDPSADEEMTYEGFVAWAMRDAVEQHEEYEEYESDVICLHMGTLVKEFDSEIISRIKEMIE